MASLLLKDTFKADAAGAGRHLGHVEQRCTIPSVSITYVKSLRRSEEPPHETHRNDGDLWAALAMPVLAMTDGQTMTPETNRTPPPPTQSLADVNQLARMLIDKGVITPHEYRRLTQPQGSSPTTYRRARVGTWDDFDDDRVRSPAD